MGVAFRLGGSDPFFTRLFHARFAQRVSGFQVLIVRKDKGAGTIAKLLLDARLHATLV